MPLLLLAALAIPASGGRPRFVPLPDHHELEAGISAPYAGPGARDLKLSFRFPDAESLMAVLWRVEVVSARGLTVRTLYGETTLQTVQTVQTVQNVQFDGRDHFGSPLPDGFYDLRLAARASSLAEIAAASGETPRTRVEQWLSRTGGDPGEFATSATEISLGNPPKPILLQSGPRSRSATATGGLPYTIYYGNLHAQTNHTDGGAAVATCGGAEVPQQGVASPTDAYEMMRTQGLGDIQVTSEHNHMYDGSTSLNLGADAAAARAKFASGLQLASDYRAAHPGFLAVYGTEFGVISNGGHCNIFNPDGLATWEINGQGQLLGDVLVQKSDYAGLYATMKARGWVGQFNHPDTSGQFIINGQSLAYDPNGDEVMTLCEVMNTSGFSNTLDMSDTSRNSFESACQKLLEAGYHVAFATNQDNHCANYGLTYGNRTAVLIPTGDALTLPNFVAALRARRAFATFDRQGQIILTTGSGALMGQQIQNVNALTLNVLWHSDNAARAVSRVRILEGVPGRNGTVTQLSDGKSALTFTPAIGKHFYYAVITEDNGDKLWSAPIWVEQVAGLVNAQVTSPAAGVEVQSNAGVTFTGSATTSNVSIVSQSWDFGDGNSATGASVTHAFVNPGTTPVSFAVTYTATDDKGVSGSASRVVIVDPDIRLNVPPTISAIAPVSTPRDTPLAGIPFTVGDAETPAGLLETTALSLDKNLIPDETLKISGTGSSRTLALAPTQGHTGTATILVTVVDGGGSFDTASFTVTVGSAQPALIISQYYEGLSNNKWIEVTNVGLGTYDASAGPMYLGLWTNPFTGGTSYTLTAIPGTLAPGASLVFRNASAVLPAASNLTGTPISSGACTFNGDDISYLTPVSAADASSFAARTDVIGENTTAWATSGSGGVGKDKSFVRNAAVVRPNAAYTAAEWTQFSNAQVDAAAAGATERLGVHVFHSPPAISDIADIDILSNGTTGPVSFTVGDAETPAALLTLTASSSNEVVLPAANVVFGGTGAARTLTATPVADQSGTVWVKITVTDTDGASASESFVLNVNPTPSGIARVIVSPATALLPNGETQQFSATVSGIGNFSQKVTWSASAGAIQQNGLYTPPASHGGPFTITATSAQDPSKSGSATIFTNRAPAAAPQAVSAAEDTPVSMVLAGSDPDGDSITFAIVTQPLHGTLTGVAPTLTYTPLPNYNGADSFTFFVNDGSTDSSAATVSIAVTPVNDPPSAAAFSVSGNEDTPLPIALRGSDPDGDALAYLVLTQPAHGVLSGTAPALTYTPSQDYFGSDSLTYKVNDGKVDSGVATVSITVAPVNDAPVAKASSRTTAEDTPKSFTLVGTDVEGDPLTYAIVTQPLHGTLGGILPNVTYTPAANYNGSDSFTFKVNDGQADSAPAKVSISVTPVNDAPVAQAFSRSTNEDTPVTVALQCTDVDGDPLSYTVTGLPAHGALSGTAPALTFTPAQDYFGSDSFTYKCSDGALDSLPAAVTLTINAINDPPIAAAQSLSLAEDGTLAITLTATDVDSTSLTYRVVAPPGHGTLTGAPPSVTYHPTADYNGPDSFSFVADDGALTSQPAAIALTITPVNDAPVASALTVITDEDTAAAVTLSARDVDGDALTYSIVSSPAHGTLSGSGANRTYTPAADYNGSDSFTYRANDGTVNSAAATVSITVRPVNDAPTANPQSVSTAEDTAKIITLTGNDKDGDSLTFSIVASPAHGTLSGGGAAQTYTPAANYNGADSFTFTASDGVAESAAATVTIAVTAVNDAPVAANALINTLQNQSAAATLSATDVDGDALTYAIIASPAHGTLTGTAPALTYTPAAGYTGSDSFTFRASDGTVNSNTATVSIVVSASNHPPVAQNGSKTTAEDTAASIALQATDPDGDTIGYTVVTQPAHGTLSGTAPALTYTPAANYNGSDSFTFTASDATLTSQPATVSITVTAVNDRPVANNTSRTVTEDTPRSFTLTGSDADNDPLTFRITVQPTHGTLDASALPDVTYTPAADYNGSDSFKFVVNDGTLDSTQATASLTIKPVNDAPVAVAQSRSTAEDTPLALTLTATDVDTAQASLTFAVATAPLHGSLTGAPPNLTYTPAADFNGSDSFTFTATDDGPLTSLPATVTLTVTAVNDAPVANAQTVSLNEDTSAQIVLGGADVEGSPLTYTIVTGVLHGALNTSALPSVTYTPAHDYNGADSFTFKVSDGALSSAVATIALAIQPVNDPPATGGLKQMAAAALVTDEDTPLSIQLDGSDPDGDPLTFVVDIPPAHGSLQDAGGGNLLYVPAQDYNGADSFSYHVSDGALDSDSVEVDLTINAVNDAPVALAQQASTDEDSALVITLEGTDAEQSALNFTLASQPQHGTLTGAPPILTYTPARDFNGSDSFTFHVDDGALTSADATVAITVRPVNDAPVASDLDVTTNEDAAVQLTLTASDADGDALAYNLASLPAHGTLTGAAPVFTYTPAANFNGIDTFTYRVGDGTLDSPLATATIHVTAVNDAPVAKATSRTVYEDTPRSFVLAGTDVDGDALTFRITVQPQHGTVSGALPLVVYTPFPDYHGNDSFRFVVNDGTADSAPATASLTVKSVDDPPVAHDQTLHTDEDTPLQVSLAADDVDLDPLDYAVVGTPAHGTLSGAGGVLLYTPSADFNGTDTFTFTAADGEFTSAAQTVTIVVDAVNDPPLAQAQSLTTAEDTALPLTLQATDPEGSALVYAIATQPAHGVLTGAAPSLTYVPARDYNGADSFTFVADDGGATSEPQTITLQVTPVNDAPVAAAQSLHTTAGHVLAVTLTASDPENDPLTFALASQPAHGSLTGSPPALTYTPDAGYAGDDSFTFTASDGALGSQPAEIALRVLPLPSGPGRSVGLLTGGGLHGQLTATVTGAGTFALVSGPTLGEMTLSPDGQFTYVASPGAVGVDQFTWQVTDDNGVSAPATFTIRLHPADIDGDGERDGVDLGLLAAAIGSNDAVEDFDGDGAVSDADLTLFLARSQP